MRPNFGTEILVQQQIRKYQSDLRLWVQNVRSARTPLDAFRIASQKPHPGHLIRSLSGMTSSDRSRSEQQVEVHLGRLIEGQTYDAGTLQALMRFAQGHWPRIWSRLEGMRRPR